MKLHRPAAVLASVVVLAGGLAVAVNAAGEDPVTLCANAKTGAVTVPNSSGACGKGSQAVSLSSQAALDALKARVASQAETNATQSAEIAVLKEDVTALSARLGQLEAGISVQTEARGQLHLGGWRSYGAVFRGQGLEPGAAITMKWDDVRPLGTSTPGQVDLAPVRSDGTILLRMSSLSDNQANLKCWQRNVVISTIDRDGFRISSPVVAQGAGCDVATVSVQTFAAEPDEQSPDQLRFVFDTYGHELKPGTPVSLHDSLRDIVLGVVDADGDFSHSEHWLCESPAFEVRATAATGETITYEPGMYREGCP